MPAAERAEKEGTRTRECGGAKKKRECGGANRTPEASSPISIFGVRAGVEMVGP